MALPKMPPYVAPNEHSETEGGGNGTLPSASRCDLRGLPVVHVRIFPTPDSGQGLTESGRDCSSKPFAWFANYNRESLCWKTWQRCLLGDWIEFSGRWPRSGLMRNGIAYRLPPLVPRSYARECLLWPTPVASDSRFCFNITGNRTNATRKMADGKRPSGATIGSQLIWDKDVVFMGCGILNPQFLEQLMGYPIEWTDLEDSETP